MKITRKQLRQIIKETLLLEKNRNPSWNLYKYTGDVWQNLKTSIPGSQEQSELASSVREIYTSINIAIMQFAALYDVGAGGVKVSVADINRNIDKAISELEKIRSFATKQPDEIALFTGDSIFDDSNDASNMILPSAVADIEVHRANVGPQLTSTRDEEEED